ncbi:PrsW family intramembrane metalloprotease, partial [Patescibacteria group bacterium]|nr:PrsW family intramembrane metalloprotease [Patescibacteria group bacterium]
MGFLESYGNNIILAFLAGFLPPLIWLWFWLKKDPHPEPRSILILTFLGGMLSVLIAFVLEYAVNIFKESFSIKETVSAAAITLFLWAIIEETVKYLSARLTALKRISFDEPVDAIIYMVTAALGFAALENVLFLFNV